MRLFPSVQKSFPELIPCRLASEATEPTIKLLRRRRKRGGGRGRCTAHPFPKFKCLLPSSFQKGFSSLQEIDGQRGGRYRLLLLLFLLFLWNVGAVLKKTLWPRKGRRFSTRHFAKNLLGKLAGKYFLDWNVIFECSRLSIISISGDYFRSRVGVAFWILKGGWVEGVPEQIWQLAERTVWIETQFFSCSFVVLQFHCSGGLTDSIRQDFCHLLLFFFGKGIFP